jgi:RNA polymerase sigma-70 factor (ECF subfamily)
MFEEERLKRAQEGDLKSIEEICASTWEALYRFIYYKVQNRQEAEDITQETYVKALSHLQKSNIKIDKYISFLKTVSLNVIRDNWRKNKRHGTSVNLDAINPEETAIEDTSEAEAQRALVQDALSQLSGEQRKVVELRILKGYSTAEVAEMMNKKESSIRVLQFRALKALAVILKNDY